MMNQRKATVSTILAVLEERGVTYELNGETPISEVLTDSDKKTIRDAVFAMFRNGQVEMSDEAKVKYQDDTQLKSYVSGLVNNWIRKAPEFNGGTTYQPKNPGSRAGSGDEQIKEMKKLLAATQDPEAKAQIEEAIAARQAELKPKVEVDYSKLPDSLRHLIPA
jgi:uncharacterized protein YqgV (UPF0045/DUF77 family)